MLKILILAMVLLLPTQSIANDNKNANANVASKLTSIDDLKNKRIGVVMGSAHESYATKNYPNATILQFDSPADVLLAVKTGKVDAALYDADPLREVFRQDHSFGLLGEPVFSFDIGVGFNKKNIEKI